MSKLTGSVAIVMFLFAAANPPREKFAKYRAVEAYEIRPGILMMPKYSADGQICEIGLERLHYSHDLIRLDSGLSRKETDEIFEELAPSDERGPQPKNILERVLGGGIAGHGMTNAEQFQNVSIYIYSALSGNALDDSKDLMTVDEVAAVLRWKNRKCQ